MNDFDFDYEAELAEKDRIISRLEDDLEEAQKEIRRLHRVCRNLESQIPQQGKAR